MLGECLPKQSWLVAVPSRPFNLSEFYHCSQFFWFFFFCLWCLSPKAWLLLCVGCRDTAASGCCKEQEGLAWSPGDLGESS